MFLCKSATAVLPSALSQTNPLIRCAPCSAEQPELEHLSEQRSPHWSQPRPPTPPPRLLALVDDGGNDSDGTLADEDIALLPTSHGADDYFYARNEWWRSSDEYYALAFPWF